MSLRIAPVAPAECCRFRKLGSASRPLFRPGSGFDSALRFHKYKYESVGFDSGGAIPRERNTNIILAAKKKQKRELVFVLRCSVINTRHSGNPKRPTPYRVQNGFHNQIRTVCVQAGGPAATINWVKRFLGQRRQPQQAEVQNPMYCSRSSHSTNTERASRQRASSGSTIKPKPHRTYPGLLAEPR